MSEKSPTPELSKRVLDAQKDGERLVAMARQNAARLGKTVGAELRADLAPMAEALVSALAERVEARVREMVAADVKLTVELADDAAPRNARDRHERETRAAIVDVRERVVGMYGQSMLSTMLLAAASPKDPRQLVTYATRAADAIEKMPASGFPESRIEGGKPSPKKWAALIRKSAEALDAALKAVDRESAEAITAQSEQRAKRDAFEAFQPKARDLLEGFLRFAGMDAEADRLDRPVGSASSADDAEESDGDAGGGGAGEETTETAIGALDTGETDTGGAMGDVTPAKAPKRK